MRVQDLEIELYEVREHTSRSESALFSDFEEKILACNGEIERVVAQCEEANVRAVSFLRICRSAFLIYFLNV
jgi:hypothetical protein